MAKGDACRHESNRLNNKAESCKNVQFLFVEV